MIQLDENLKKFENGKFANYDSIIFTEESSGSYGIIPVGTIMPIVGYFPRVETLRIKYGRRKHILKKLTDTNFELTQNSIRPISSNRTSSRRNLCATSRVILTGPKGGKYYLTASNRKRYIK